MAAQEIGGSGQQENLYQPFKSGSYPLRLTTFLGDAPQAELGTLLPVHQMLVCSFICCHSVLKARALALLSEDGSCRCILAGTERKNAPGGFRAEGLERHAQDHTHKECQSTEPQSRYRQWGSLLSVMKVKQGPRLSKTCLWQCPLVNYQHAEVSVSRLHL